MYLDYCNDLTVQNVQSFMGVQSGQSGQSGEEKNITITRLNFELYLCVRLKDRETIVEWPDMKERTEDGSGEIVSILTINNLQHKR